jgi:hypothetical protein
VKGEVRSTCWLDLQAGRVLVNGPLAAPSATRTARLRRPACGGAACTAGGATRERLRGAWSAGGRSSLAALRMIGIGFELAPRRAQIPQGSRRPQRFRGRPPATPVGRRIRRAWIAPGVQEPVGLSAVIITAFTP